MVLLYTVQIYSARELQAKHASKTYPLRGYTSRPPKTGGQFTTFAPRKFVNNFHYYKIYSAESKIASANRVI